MSIHNDIMNIAVDNPQLDNMTDKERIAYKLGHRDARHAAAELSLQTEQAAKAALEDLEWFERERMGGIQLTSAKLLREALGVSRTYRIRCIENIEEQLYWSNDDGWVDADSATVFTQEERDTLNLPMSGVWEIAY